MSHIVEKREGGEIELKITVLPSEYEPFLKSAAERLSNRVAIKGFRKGHIPLDILKREVGEMGILNEALESILESSFFKALQDEKLETIGMPKINVEKIAPQNEIVYTAKVSLLPAVKLPDLSKIKVKKVVTPVDQKEIDETLLAIQNMHGTETEKDRPAEGKDMVLIDMDMQIDKVSVDGGTAKDYRVYLGEEHYIPGFNEKLAGIKKGEKREFSLDFPKTHYQKMLAGKTVDFVVTAKGVFERIPAELNEEFAKKLGQESVQKLKDLLVSNLASEAEQKADKNFEVEMFEKIMEASSFEEIPAVLIDSEKEKMFYELKRDIEKMGMTIEQYLADIKKKEDELFKEFTAQAEKRAKAALLSRGIAKEQNILISDAEIDAEIELMKKTYANDETAQENLKRKEIRLSIANVLQNKRVVSFLKETVSSEK